MIREELTKRSPIRILESTTRGGLGKGNVGVFAAFRGVGKTACLVHFAIDALLRERKVLHISFTDHADHIYSWYENIFEEMRKAYGLEMAAEIHEDLERNRMIMYFNIRRMAFADLKQKINKLTSDLKFHPEVIIFDGFEPDASSEEFFKGFKSLAVEYGAELWTSYTLPQEQPVPKNAALIGTLSVNLSSISVIVLISVSASGTFLKLLKDHRGDVTDDTHLVLNPTSLLITEEA
jgi:hypothetical protein